jgi:AraC family transcriptional regulator of arabinose operon
LPLHGEVIILSRQNNIKEYQGIEWEYRSPHPILSRVYYHVLCSTQTCLGENWDCQQSGDPFTRLYLTVSGEAQLRFKSMDIPLIPGRLVLVPSHTSFEQSCDDQMTLSWSHFYAKKDRGFDLFDHDHEPQFMDLEHPSEQLSLFEQMAHQSEIDSASHHLKKNIALQRLILPFVDEVGSGLEDEKASFLPILEQIEVQLNNLPSLEILASHLGMSPSHFSRKFKRVFGLSPIKYIRSRRISMVKVLLLESHDSLEKIAHAVGLNDGFYLSRFFKDMTGESPSLYRKRVKNDMP